MEKNQISTAQVIFLLFLSRLFTSLTYYPDISRPVSGTATLYSYGIGALVELLLFLPILVMAKRFPLRSIGMNLRAALGRFGGLAVWLYYLYLVLLAAHTLAHFQFFMTNAVFPNGSVWIIILPMLAVSMYAAHIGIEGIARSGFLIFIGFLIAFCFIIFSSLSDVEWGNIYPIQGDAIKELTVGSYGITVRTTEPVLLAFLLPYLNDKPTKAAFGFVLLSTVILFVSGFFILTVLGSFSYSQTFPFYALATLSEVSTFQRMDALYMGIWVLVGFVKLSVLLIVAKDLFILLFPDRFRSRSRSYGLWITGFLVFLFALPACFHFQLLSRSYRLVNNGVVILLFVVFFPTVFLLRQWGKKKLGKGRGQ